VIRRSNPQHLTIPPLEERVPPDQYKTYLTRRRVFVQLFTDVDAGSFQVRVRSNRLASVEVPLSGKRVTEVQHKMQKLIEAAADAIDQTLTPNRSAKALVAPCARLPGRYSSVLPVR
jgi:hypothetical protein